MMFSWFDGPWAKWATLGAVVVVSLAMRWHHFDDEIAGYHAWRQCHTQTVTLNFALGNHNILNPTVNTFKANGSHIERYEFPLMQWLFSWPHKITGMHPWPSRALTFVLSVVTLGAFFSLCKNLGLGTLTASASTWLVAFSPLMYYYGINPLPDNMALMWGMMALALAAARPNTHTLVVALLCIALATAVKLPFIVLAPALLPSLLTLWRDQPKNALVAIAIAVVLFAPVATWYAIAIPQWANNPVLHGGWQNGGDTLEILKYVWLMMLPEMLLNYAAVPLFLLGIWAFFKYDGAKKPWAILCSAPFVLAYYVFELHAIGKAHDYYLMPFIPLLFVTVAAGIEFISPQIGRWIWLPLAVAPVTCYLKAEGRWKPTGLSAVMVEHQEQLRQMLPPDAVCIVGNDVSQRIMPYHLQRACFVFWDSTIPAEFWQTFRSNGATHLVTTNSIVCDQPWVQQAIGDTLIISEKLCAYQLKPK